MFKTAIATAILGLGIAGAYFVIQTSNPAPKVGQKIGNNEVPSDPFVEKVGSAPAIAAASGENLTDKFLTKIGDDIKKNNPKVSTSADGKKAIAVPDVNALTDDLLSSAINSFNINKLYPEVSDADLNIQNNSDKSSLIKYSADLDKILSQENSLPTTGEINSEEVFNGYISAGLPIYEKIYADFRKLPVPEKFSAYHKKELELIGAKINILRSLSAISKDPVTAIIMTTYAGQIETDLEKNYQDIKSMSK